MAREPVSIRSVMGLSHSAVSTIGSIDWINKAGEAATPSSIVTVGSKIGDDYNLGTVQDVLPKLVESGRVLEVGETDSGEKGYQVASGTLQEVSNGVSRLARDIGGEMCAGGTDWAFPEYDEKQAEQQYTGPGEVSTFTFVRLSTSQRSLLHAMRAREVATGVSGVTTSDTQDALASQQIDIPYKTLNAAAKTLEEYGLIHRDRVDGEGSPCVGRVTEAGIALLTLYTQCWLGNLEHYFAEGQKSELKRPLEDREVTTEVGIPVNRGEKRLEDRGTEVSDPDSSTAEAQADD